MRSTVYTAERNRIVHYTNVNSKQKCVADEKVRQRYVEEKIKFNMQIESTRTFQF